MWREIESRFNTTNGGLKQLAISKLMHYKYQANRPAGENLYRWNTILNRIAILGVKIPDDLKITVLLGAHPIQWEPFRQAFTAREDSARTLTHLVEAIEAEALRRGNFNTKEVTALFSNLNTSGRKHARRKGFRRHSKKTVTHTTELTCYNCQRKGHVKSQCTAPRNYGSGQQQHQPGTSRHRQQHQQKHQGSRNSKRRLQPQANVTEALVAEALIVELDQPEANCMSSGEAYVIDSGSNYHMTSVKTHMINYTPYQQKQVVKLGGSRTLSAQGSGSARITFLCNGSPTTIQLNEVLFVPNLRRNLISVSRLTDDGFKVKVARDSITLTQGGATVQAERKNGLYILYSSNFAESNVADSDKKKRVSLDEAHRVFSHINVDTLKKMLQREGYEVIPDYTSCKSCVEGKMHRASYRSKPASARPPRIGWISSDVCEVRKPSYNKHKFFITFTDHYSRFRKVYFLKKKKGEVTKQI